MPFVTINLLKSDDKTALFSFLMNHPEKIGIHKNIVKKIVEDQMVLTRTINHEKTYLHEYDILIDEEHVENMIAFGFKLNGVCMTGYICYYEDPTSPRFDYHEHDGSPFSKPENYLKALISNDKRREIIETASLCLYRKDGFDRGIIESILKYL